MHVGQRAVHLDQEILAADLHVGQEVDAGHNLRLVGDQNLVAGASLAGDGGLHLHTRGASGVSSAAQRKTRGGCHS